MKRAATSLIAVLLLPALAALQAQPATVNGPIAPDGTEVALELPATLHLKNKGGIDRACICVITSTSHRPRRQNEPLPANCHTRMHRHPGRRCRGRDSW